MAATQNFGIQYPFENSSDKLLFVDLNTSYKERAKSELLHLIFTKKGQRYRMPGFGTDLIKYIFEPSDDETWESIKAEISEQVEKYIPSIKLIDIEILKNEEHTNKVYTTIRYALKTGESFENNEITVRVV